VGLILDSSVLIAEERAGQNAYEALSRIAGQARGEELAVLVVTIVELAHGIARSNSAQRRDMRSQFLNELLAAVPVHPVSVSIAMRAGALDGESTARGIRIAFSDLLIGATALELGFKVATLNLRHFQMIAGLEVVSI